MTQNGHAFQLSARRRLRNFRNSKGCFEKAYRHRVLDAFGQARPGRDEQGRLLSVGRVGRKFQHVRNSLGIDARSDSRIELQRRRVAFPHIPT